MARITIKELDARVKNFAPDTAAGKTEYNERVYYFKGSEDRFVVNLKSGNFWVEARQGNGKYEIVCPSGNVKHIKTPAA